MTNAPFAPYDDNDPTAAAVDGAKTPGHRGRKIAAAVSAGAFAGIAIGLVATNAGADDRPETLPTGTGNGVQGQAPFGQFGGQPGTEDLDGDGRTGDPGDVFGDAGSTDQFGGSTGQFAPPSGGATPTPFGGQTAPDTNSGGS